MASKDKIVRVRCRCSNCGGSPRNHRVICSHKVKWDTVDIYGFTAYEIVKCMGCDSVRFRVSETNSEDMDWDEDSGTAVFTEFERGIYPDDVPGRRQAENVSQYPDNVAKMYLEMIKCFNAGALTLAGGGLQAIVEAICQEQQATGRSLETRIDGLVTQGYLVQAEADLLHEERYIRNFALHEMKTPTKADLEDGLKIVEGQMNTIYVLPFRAAR